MKVVLEGATEGPGGRPFRKEFEIESFTDVGDNWVLIDEDGDGRLMITTEELAEISGADGEWSP